jgi:cyclase
MRRIRVIPVLTLDNYKLVKTIKFKKPNYIGDPVNAVKIFNEKEVDEIVVLDITATQQNREPNYSKIEEIASEAFMPFAYGGAITNSNQIEQLFKLGIEKVILNTSIPKNPDLIKKASKRYGSQSIVASVDVKKSLFGRYHVYIKSGNNKIDYKLIDYIKFIEDLGAGEIMLNSIDKDGTFLGYDNELIQQVSKNTSLPLIACGGASSIDDFLKAVQSGASAVAAGSMFVYRGNSTNSILINYPNQQDLQKNLFEKI